MVDSSVACDLKIILSSLIKGSVNQDKLYNADTLRTEHIQDDKGEHVVITNDGAPSYKRSKLTQSGLYTALNCQSQEYLTHIISNVPEEFPTLPVTPIMQQHFDDAVKAAEIVYNTDKYERGMSELEAVFQDLIDNNKGAFDNYSLLERLEFKPEDSLFEFTLKNYGEIDSDKATNEDTKTFTNIIKKMFQNASITDVNYSPIRPNKFTLSVDIMEQLEAKAEAGTLADEFSAAMAQVQAKAQRGGGRG